MLLTVYLCGWLVTTIGALVAANRFSDHRTASPLAHGTFAVLAGVLWPVLVVGVAEVLAIVIATRRMRIASARQHGWALMEHVAPGATAPATEGRAAAIATTD